jgi:site-specific DNA-methyltransferase (adenine-specific)/modification methylase
VTVETIGPATLYLGDCREILPALGRVEAIVTDPPYGIADAAKRAGKRGGKRSGGDNVWHAASTWDAAIDPEFPRLCGEAAPLVAWFGHWRKRAEVEAAIALPIRAEIVWAKDCHAGPPCPLAMRDERIWLFSAAGITGATFETSVWDCPVIPTWAFKHHKNEKPLALMKRLLAFLDPALCCDPFMGSGTTGVAAVEGGRQFIGIERDLAHFAVACRRIEAAQRQGDLFVKPAPAPSLPPLQLPLEKDVAA